MAGRVAVSRRLNTLDPSVALDTSTKQYVDRLGRVGAPISYTVSSSQCNSATLVVTNVLYGFTAVSGGIYRARFEGQYVCDVAANTVGAYLLHAAKNNSLANTDSIVGWGGKFIDRSHKDAGGINWFTFSGEFTASASGNYTVGVAINMPNLSGSDPGPYRLYANTADKGYINTLYLDRVA